MPKPGNAPAAVDTIPDKLKPFKFHGVDIDHKEGQEQAWGECILCNRERKFCVSLRTGQWDCKVCGAAGNIVTFLRQLWEASLCDEGTLAPLAKEWGLLNWMTVKDFGGIRKSPAGYWIVPGYNAEGKLSNLYKYCYNNVENRWMLFVTTGLPHQIFGMPHFDPKKPHTYILEGLKDPLVFWETIRYARRDNEALQFTGALGKSLYAETNILAAPTATVFNDAWATLFGNTKVSLIYDNDHPRKNKHTGQEIEPAAWSGMRRAATILSRAEQPPSEVHCIQWGEGNYNPELKHGYDVRDRLCLTTNIRERLTALETLLRLIKPIPEEWVEGRTAEAKRTGSISLDLIPCSSYKELVSHWKKAMLWIDGLDRGLSSILATIMSTPHVDDQLWLKLIGPPACGKSTLCEAASTNKRWVYAKSTLRGFHSGYRETGDDDEDNSLLAMLNNKTFITKDGDTLLQAPNLGQILSEARDIYDKTSRTSYRTKASKDYENIPITWVLAGTSSLRVIDESELGERMLDCIIVDKIDEETEDEILWRVANRMSKSMRIDINDDDGKLIVDPPELTIAKRMTGGYIDYLRENSVALLNGLDIKDSRLLQCASLGKLVAYLRARPSVRQDETAEREFATRLVAQLTRYAMCTAVVLNRTELDEEVMRRTKQVAFDTARGITMRIVEAITKNGPLESLTLAQKTGRTLDKEQPLLRFLSQIGVLEYFKEQIRGQPMRNKWRLTERFRKLYQRACDV